MRKKVHRYTRDDYVFVYQMLRFRSQGWSYVRIGEMFNKHHSTIIHWCKRFSVDVGSPIPDQAILDCTLNRKPLPNRYKYLEVIEQPVNRGKLRYADYLKEEKRRQQNKHRYGNIISP